MKQSCLCKYLGVTCNHPDTFLHIPLSIRQQIYLYAGLITDSYICYPHYKPVEGDSECTIQHENYLATYNLRNVCAQICDEVEAMLVNRNVCVYKDDTLEEGLEFLRELTPYACSMLRNLAIHLHVRPRRYPGYGPEPESLTWRRIEMWQAAASNILSHATPRQLTLHLICDTEDSKQTAAVLQPLYNFPGLLFELQLRLLERKPNDQKLITLARETALYAQAPDPRASGSFRFFDLPAEIRQNVFEYTNLVTPHRKVHWDPMYGFRAAYIFCECDGSVCLEEDLHNGRRMGSCGGWSRVTGDFCMKHYASYSSRCSHSKSPLPLLLTSRAMYQEAIDFFYSSNRIVIQPHIDAKSTVFAGVETNLLIDQQPTTLMENLRATADSDTADIEEYFSSQNYLMHDSTKIFMEKVGTKAVKLMRNLEIVFPQIGPVSDLSDTATAYREWCTAIAYLASLAGQEEDVRKLTLAVHIWTKPCSPFLDLPLESTAHILGAQGPRLLQPLRALPQLERLFVHLEWPGHWSPQKLLHDIETSKRPRKESLGCGIGLHYIPRAIKGLTEKEVDWEKMVMGAEYDSYSMGKANELPSQWIRAGWDSSC
ncbi:hypothetical protein PISL3812_00529 [Talaromyces islandicus]|uniref:DUF7730 domain-containing protein n=1 Tax=Talaromyces islandicus TaxID=28573 RepID=A0A0U1LLI5_TALIS|nr:hypothetical protein PISL3812_00529 [Talaromyces islandicus]